MIGDIFLENLFYIPLKNASLPKRGCLETDNLLFFAIFKGLTNKLIPTMNSYVSEAEYEEMMDAENAQFGELKAVPVSALLSIDNETASNMLFY